MKDRNVGQYQ